MTDKSNREKNETMSFTILVPESTQTSSIEIISDDVALKMAVVERNSVRSLNEVDWEQPGVYILLSRHVLLSRHDSNGRWSAYVGKATGLKTRLSYHKNNKDWWYRALLIRSDRTDGFNAAEIGWLEGRFYDLLAEADDVELDNTQEPDDKTLPLRSQRPLERFIQPVRRVLMMLGHNPVTDDVYDEELDSTTQSDQGKRSDVTLAQLVEAGLVTVGEELVSNMKKWPATARVGEHGKIEFNGEKYDKPSNPAQAVREGKSTNGWTFWAVQRGSEKVILNRLREQFEHSNEGTKM